MSVHTAVRANPCAGAPPALGCGPNHGKQIGTPPRIGLPGSNALLRLMKRTGAFACEGCQRATCAPWKYTAAVARPVEISRCGSSPGTSWTGSGRVFGFKGSGVQELRRSRNSIGRSDGSADGAAACLAEAGLGDRSRGRRLVPEVGVEPTHPEGHGILSPARLPVSPLRPERSVQYKPRRAWHAH